MRVYYPQEGKLHVHQSRVCVCPQEFPAGFYWYGGKRKGHGRPPKWVNRLLQSGSADNTPPLSNRAPDQTNDSEDDHFSASHKEGNYQTLPNTQKVRPEQETTPRMFKRPQSWWIADQKNRSLM